MAGSLAIPFVFAGIATCTDSISHLDTDLSTIAAYINVREVTVGLFAARPAAGTHGATFYATDIGGGTLYLDTGVAWVTIGSFAAVGTLANRPVAGTSGRLYFATDGAGALYLDTGAAWVSIPPAILDPENKVRWLEDFQSVPLPKSVNYYAFDTGVWMFGPAQPNVANDNLIGGKISVTHDGVIATTELAVRALENAATFLVQTQASKNPTFFLSTAQKGVTAAHTRRIGWMGTESPAADPANGIFIRYSTTAAVSFVCRSGGVETTLAAGHNAANGVYHTYRMVVTGGGTNVQCFVDGVSVGNIATNIPAAALGFCAGDSANNVADGFSLDYVGFEATR